MNSSQGNASAWPASGGWGDVASLSAFASHFLCGLCTLTGNALLSGAILGSPKLRQRHEMIIIAGLSVSDFLYGVGYTLSGPLQFVMTVQGTLFLPTTPWECMQKVHSWFYVVGSQASALMLVVLSLDRLLAVRFFAFYRGLTASFGVWAVGLVYAYTGASLAVVVALSFFRTEDRYVPAACFSVHVSTEAYQSYQPAMQMVCGISSVVLFGLALVFYKRHVGSSAIPASDAKLKQERKLTRAVGFSVMVTLVTYVIPHGLISFLNTALKDEPAIVEMVGRVTPFVWTFSATNSIVNILIFGLKNHEIKAALRARLSCRCGNGAGSQANSTARAEPTSRMTTKR